LYIEFFFHLDPGLDGLPALLLQTGGKEVGMLQPVQEPVQLRTLQPTNAADFFKYKK
jgi:hypothetical protein